MCRCRGREMFLRFTTKKASPIFTMKFGDTLRQRSKCNRLIRLELCQSRKSCTLVAHGDPFVVDADPPQQSCLPRLQNCTPFSSTARLLLLVLVGRQRSITFPTR